MAKSNKVLSIDITNESITIIELTASAKKQTMIRVFFVFIFIPFHNSYSTCSMHRFHDSAYFSVSL